MATSRVAIVKRREADRRRLQTPMGRARKLVRDARYRSKRKRLPCTITPELVCSQIELGVCSMTGLPLALALDATARGYAPSLDRIIPELGYVPGNVRVVCHIVNVARSNLSDASLYAMSLALVNRMNQETP